MALKRTRQAAIVALGSASFFMSDGNRMVRVDVGKELLARLDAPPPTTTGEYVEQLVRHQRHFAQIARSKYRRGDFDRDVNVLVVRIIEADLVG